MSLGVKQLSDNPYSNINDLMDEDKRVTCVVSKVKPEGVEVIIGDSLNAFIKSMTLQKINLIKDLRDLLKVKKLMLKLSKLILIHKISLYQLRL